MRLRLLAEPLRGASYGELVAAARAAEAAGFDAFFRSDHYLGTDPDHRQYRPTDAWTTLGGLAGDTTSIRLGTLVTASTFRLPGPLAMAVASVDEMSGGRVELGIGAAWYEAEHERYGIPFQPLKVRYERLAEQLEIVHGLWGGTQGEPYSFEGAHYRLQGATTFPRLVQSPHPPVVLGGSGPRRTPLLAARFADELNTGTRDGFVERVAAARRHCEELGRDPASLGLSTTVPVCADDTAGGARRKADELGPGLDRLLQRGVVGTPADVADRLEQLAGLGIDTVYVHCFDPSDLDQVGLLGEALVDQMATVGPAAPGRRGRSASAY